MDAGYVVRYANIMISASTHMLRACFCWCWFLRNGPYKREQLCTEQIMMK